MEESLFFDVWVGDGNFYGLHATTSHHIKSIHVWSWDKSATYMKARA